MSFAIEVTGSNEVQIIQLVCESYRVDQRYFLLHREERLFVQAHSTVVVALSMGSSPLGHTNNFGVLPLHYVAPSCVGQCALCINCA